MKPSFRLTVATESDHPSKQKPYLDLERPAQTDQSLYQRRALLGVLFL